MFPRAKPTPDAEKARQNSREGFTGVVLTGGQSTRMGRDKALMEVDGVALAVRTASVLTAARARAVFAVGGDRGALTALGLEVTADLYPGEGPLGAILTAFAVAATDLVVVLACDLPRIDAETVEGLVSAIGDHDAAVAVTDRNHPLCAAYRTSRCAPLFQRAFGSGERAVHRVLEGMNIVRVEVGNPDVVRNVNRPGDLS